MPNYDFRCKECSTEFTEFYKSYDDYDAANPVCPRCQSEKLARVINRVNVGAGVTSHDYTRMTTNEMLGVFESGNSRDVNAMFSQIRGTHPAAAQPYHEQAKKLQSSSDSSSGDKSSSASDS